MDLATFERTLEALVCSDPSEMADASSLEALESDLCRLEAFVAKVVSAFEASGACAEEGARSATLWLASRCRLPRPAARRQVRVGQALAGLPACEEAFAAGEITAGHVEAVARLRRNATEEALARDEAMLVDQAKGLRFDQFARLLAYWEQLADPDGTERSAEWRRSRRDVTLARSFEGCYLGRITLDELAGGIVAGELDRLERHLFEADRSAAKEELGRDPLLVELSRTSAQRRADALVEMARRSAAAPDEAAVPPVLLSVLVGYETLHGRICELANGTVVTPGSLLNYLDGALVERAVFSSPTRVEVSAKTRLFSGATRRAIELRDRECQHPCCDVRASRCEVDHVVPASRGGPTTQENGRLLCGFHNRLRNTVELPP